MNCIIIEDEPLAIEKLTAFIDKLSTLNLLASFHLATSAINYLKENTVDLIFLDIEMKELTGIQFLEVVRPQAKIILTTAYEEYALQGYDLQVSDYLLKPITFERFVKACEKVIQEHTPRNTTSHKRIYIKTEYRLEGIDTAEILYIEGMGDYKRIVTAAKKVMTLETFPMLLEKLPANLFFRVHNSFVVSLDKIDQVERNRIIIKDKRIPISESQAKAFYERLNI